MGRIPLAICIGVVAAAHVEAALVIDFEVFRVEDAQIHDRPGVLEFDGFRITSVPPPGNAFRYVSPGTLHSLFAGSTSVWNGQSNAENVLTAIDETPFTLLSIDLAAIGPGALEPSGPTDPGPFDLTFTATHVDGGTTANTFTINTEFLAFDTFHFTGFENVVSVSWFQGSGFNPPAAPLPGEASHQFDNIRISPVPEPSAVVTWLGCISLLLAGLRRAVERRHIERAVGNGC
jgi:hypothetical protein